MDEVKQFVNNEGCFVVSEFTKYELFRGAANKRKRKSLGLLVAPFHSVEIQSGFLLTAGFVYSVLKSEVGRAQNIDEGDALLATYLAVFKNSYLLTSNFKDFPPSCFNVESKYTLVNKDGALQKFVYLISADRESINRIYNERFSD